MKTRLYIYLALFVLYILTIKKSIKKIMTEKDALKRIYDEYGLETARNVERMFRLETNHFKSKGYQLTNGAGMEAVMKNFPFGWSKKYFLGVDYSNDLVHMTDSGGRSVYFIKFGTTYDGMKVIANWLQSHRVGNWYSLDPNKQKEYETKISKINPIITNSL